MTYSNITDLLIPGEKTTTHFYWLRPDFPEYILPYLFQKQPNRRRNWTLVFSMISGLTAFFPPAASMFQSLDVRSPARPLDIQASGIIFFKSPRVCPRVGIFIL